MSALIIWMVVWIVLGLLVGALASVIAKDEPPYGLAVDILAGVLTMVVVGLADYYILRLMGIEGTVAFTITVLEPLMSAGLLLWLLRVIKRRRGG